MRKILGILTILVMSISLTHSHDFSIISHKVNKQQSLYRFELQSIFLLNTAYWDNGELIVPIFLKFNSTEHKLFISSYLDMSPNAFNNAIALKLKTKPNSYVIEDTPELVLSRVKQIRGAIAYIDNQIYVNSKLNSVHTIDIL